ncbi:beta-lactamase family protein [Kordiimonas sp. SCSIO 12603]|uniref:serine hydrolase domain-containing protein n=1 Tax=Kordiimonas sp. SCSIO 12603 TaxID=2829596 RepID=UPI00210767EC|nr:serine hydrolase domain-containing protein [Kordiimonas sp. SCSIO 12603]UTW58072.1 beta-lactamase family protein [Kordiimonas sp. SCSIO 12603]
MGRIGKLALLAASSLALTLSPVATKAYSAEEGTAIQATNPPLNKIIQTITNNNNFHGTILVADNGKITHKAGYGFANMEWEIPNSSDSNFYIASLSKSIVAALMVKMAEAGELKLDDTITDHLPGFPADYAKDVTLQHLLTHTSGIPNYIEFEGWFTGKFRGAISKEEFHKTIASYPLKFPIGTDKHYSNSNYYILGSIIEEVTGKSFSAVMQERVFEPLDMVNSGIHTQGRVIPRLALPYESTGEGSYCSYKVDDYCASGYTNMNLFRGGAAIHTTAEDLLKFDQAFYGTDFLSDSAKDTILGGKIPFGWNIHQVPFKEGDAPTKVISYNGGINGYTSLMLRFPNEHRTIIILNNSGNGYRGLVNIGMEIASQLYK